MKFRFMISNWRKNKSIWVYALSFKEAYSKVRAEYPNWAINCAWPVWPQPN
jgi:hypothetical protein